MIATFEKVLDKGEEPDATYGTRYIVKFEEFPQTFEISRKSTPVVGGIEDGEVINGKWVKAKKEYTSPPPARTPYTPRPDNSDGQRQGMCINNAANYVNGTPDLKAEEWAKEVHSYAKALYSLGDLTVASVVEVPDAVSSVFDK